MDLPKKCDSEQYGIITVWLRIRRKSVTHGCDVQCSMVMHLMKSSTKGVT